MKTIDESLGMVIKKYYLVDGYSATKIAKLLGKQTITICRYLKREGIAVINKAMISKITSEVGLKIENMYKSGISLSRISKDIDISISVISKYLKSKGIEVINYHNLSKFNENVFDRIDTEEKAYWLGFIFADGYVSSRDNGFELSLSKKDINHLYKFNSFMGFNGNNVKVSTTKHQEKVFDRCRWGITNKHLWNTLNSYGCVPKKSNILKFPTGIPETLLKDFIRGYFDGDGCITYVKRSGKVFSKSTIIGTREFLTKIQEILRKEGISSAIVVDKRMTSNVVLNIGSSNERQFLSFLYKQSTIFLDRKFNRFKFFSICRSNEELLEFIASENGEG